MISLVPPKYVGYLIDTRPPRRRKPRIRR
jgi:hypothetical protein